MSHSFRLLETGYSNAFYNMGLDSAILDSVASGESLPTLRLYGWKPSAISLGYFQSAEEEINLSACREHDVDVVRRITGGGAVFHDAEVTYSIGIPESHPLASPSIPESYRILCQGIIEGLALLGIGAEFAPINDIIVDGKKISGNAQTRRNHCIFQHGTILLSVDAETMFSLLRVPKEKSRGKLIQDIMSRVTSVSAVTGRDLGFETVAGALKSGFASALDIDFRTGQASADELKQADAYAFGKFSSKEWTFRR